MQGFYLGDVQLAGSLKVANTRLSYSHSWHFSHGCCVLASPGSALISGLESDARSYLIFK